MATKNFIGNCKPGKYPEQVDIGLKIDDVQKLLEAVQSSSTGWVNLRLSKGKESGKPYMELLTPQ